MVVKFHGISKTYCSNVFMAVTQVAFVGQFMEFLGVFGCFFWESVINL
jgi:hypothetical protein